MAERQQALADVILKDPDVVGLSSFIGVDGTNTTLNTGRFLINLQARDDQRRLTASEIIRRLQHEVAKVPGIALYMQPVQDLTIEFDGQPHAVPVRAGGREPRRVRHLGAAADRAAAGRCPALADVASDLQQEGLALDIDHRPRDRGPLRHHAGDGGQRALRRASASASSRPSTPSRTSTA